MAPRSLSGEIARNSFHSVSSTSASASRAASIASVQYSTPSGSIGRAASMPAGSNTRSRAPCSASRCRIGIEAASRMSSVSGLKVRPSTATVLPRRLLPQAARMRPAMPDLRASFTDTVASTSRDGAPASWAIRISASVSLGKQEPP